MALDFETAAMVEELIGKAELAAVEALNAGAAKIADRSQQTVPRSMDPAHEGQSLAESMEVDLAEPGKLEATVSYNVAWAAAQESGAMDYYSSRAGHEVHWKAQQYTVEGTGAHYLEDAGKSVIPEMEGLMEAQGQIYFGK